MSTWTRKDQFPAPLGRWRKLVRRQGKAKQDLHLEVLWQTLSEPLWSKDLGTGSWSNMFMYESCMGCRLFMYESCMGCRLYRSSMIKHDQAQMYQEDPTWQRQKRSERALWFGDRFLDSSEALALDRKRFVISSSLQNKCVQNSGLPTRGFLINHHARSTPSSGIT